MTVYWSIARSLLLFLLCVVPPSVFSQQVGNFHLVIDGKEDRPESGERGRVRIQNNTVVTDNGRLLRGAHGNCTNKVYADLSWWERMRDEFGLNVVRLDTRITSPPDSNNLPDMKDLNAVFRDVDIAVDMAGKAGMYIVIDNHTSCCGKYNAELVRRFWEVAAPRYKDRTHVIYEVQNEPVKGANYSSTAIAFQEDMYRYIRQRAPNTHIILWSAMYGANSSFLSKVESADIDYSNASVGIHPYHWEKQDPQWQNVARLRDKHPVIINEFTTDSWKGDTDPMAIWRFAERTGLSWIALDLRDGGNHGDGVYDPNKWPVELWRKP
jgi:hypothetical protein